MPATRPSRELDADLRLTAARPNRKLDVASLKPVMTNKLKQRRDNHKTLIENLRVAIDSIGESAACMEKHQGPEAPSGAVDKLKDCLHQLARAEYEVEDFCGVLDRAALAYADHRHMEVGISDVLAECASQSSSAAAKDPAKHRTVVQALQKVWRVHRKGPMPGTQAHGADDGSDVEEADVPGGGSSLYVNIKCPVSLKEISTLQRPMRGVECGHLFEESAIKELLRRQATTPCPIYGCRVKLTREGIELARDVARENKRNGYKPVAHASTQAREHVDVEDV
eukprot:jgi/Mesvir1/10175/Mv05152-RA.1